jgi:hypothetical protein
LKAKIYIEALVPVGYTDELLEQHVRNVLPSTFRVFTVAVQQDVVDHGEEKRREELKKPGGNPAEKAAQNAAAKLAKKQAAQNENEGKTDSLVEDKAAQSTTASL